MGLGELGSGEEELFFPGFHPQSLRAFKHPDRHDKAKDVMERTHGRETRGYSIQVRELATFVPQAGNNQLKEIARPANLPSTTQRIFRSVSRLFSFCQKYFERDSVYKHCVFPQESTFLSRLALASLSNVSKTFKLALLLLFLCRAWSHDGSQRARSTAHTRTGVGKAPRR